MPISLNDFWKLAIDSRLLSGDECQRLDSAFARVRGAEKGNSITLAEWLLASGVLSRYQTSVLLTGKARPFLFGEYKIFDRHDSGRLKGLYRAVHLPTGYSVSLYFLSSGLLKEPRPLAAVLHQAQAATDVRNSCLSRVFEFVERKSAKFVVLEDFAGITLADYLQAQAVAPADACRIVRDLAFAAAALHEHGLAHGDIRPENVWLTAEGGVKLLGFPLAHDPAEPAGFRINEAEPSARLSAQADYLAPELAHARRSPDSIADVYSLGCLTYALLIGRPPFAGGDVHQKLARHASEPAPTLDQFGMPPALSQLVAHMMAKNPPVRLDSAAEVATRLTAFANPDPTAGRPINATLAAFEQILAQRQAPPVAADTSGEVPAEPTVAMEPLVPVSPPQLMASVSDSGNLAIADRPTLVTKHALAAGDLLPVDPRVARLRAKPRPVPPMILAVGALALFAMGGVLAGLATRSSDSGDQQQTSGGQTLASSADSSAKHKSKKKKKPKHSETDPASAATDASSRDSEEFEDPDPVAVPVSPTKSIAHRPEKPAFQEVDDDGSSLWISPTAGGPISLRYLPAGAQLFLIARPSALLSDPEGSKMVDGLGPAGQYAKDQIKAITGIDPSRIEQLIVGFYLNEMSSPSAAFVVRLNDAASEEDLAKGWNNPAPATHEGKKYFKNGQTAYYIPAEENGRVLAIMPAAEAEATLSSDGPKLSKEMDKLLAETDSQRHFTLMAAPFALFRAGKTIFVGELERLQEPLDHFLGPGIPAALLSVHATNDLFVELRIAGDSGDEPSELASRYRSQLEKVPDDLEAYLVSLNPQPYGRMILARFPQMIRTLVDYTRVGEDHRQAVLRAYLPVSAGHNLVMGTELALFERPGGAGPSAVKNSAPQKPSGPAEALKQKISLSFPRDTLEKCMEMLGKEIDTEVVILGGDLQLDGITKNQSFGLDERDKPAEEILRTVLNKANPDGKLVYVIKPKDGGKDAIFITTRSAAEKRGDKLPPELAQNRAPGK